MKLRPERVAAQLRASLPPLWLIAGDEPLLVQETRDAVLSAARERGFDERLRFDVETGFDWDRLRGETQALSLFAQRRVFDLRLSSGKLTKAGDAALGALEAAADTVVVISGPRLEKDALRSSWVQRIEADGVHVACWPVELSALPEWLIARAGARGRRLSLEAARLLAERVEGNLLAAAQEIEKLCLLFPEGLIEAEALASAVTDSSRYSVFDLSDALLAGQAGRALRILAGLRGEGGEPNLILWSLARELRILDEAATGDAAMTLRNWRVIERRQPLYRAALKRFPSSAGVWRALLVEAGRIDRAIKGVGAGEPWLGLERLALRFCGIKPPAPGSGF
ncbi:MAG: DNA polymerase III subunit delta [Halothiobacillaceae bacterium]|jgi:DNA polymerase-3 subunit delta|nr:DNA polymerase III subunit delta [Halothiobacillaceae bacterium]MDY0050551.1 DNA polymerase III subunit delta [Halothiobacillaceae bacterium]